MSLLDGGRGNVNMSNIKPSGDSDAEVVLRQATLAIPLKARGEPQSEAVVEAHNLTYLPAAPQCDMCVQVRGKSDWYSGVKCDSDIPCAQLDFQFISGVGVWCPEAQAKATVLTLVDTDTGYVGVLLVTRKNPDNFMVRSSGSFIDKLRAEKTKLRYDIEPAMRQLAERIASFRHPRSTILEPINRRRSECRWSGRAHQSIQATAHTLRTDYPRTDL